MQVLVHLSSGCESAQRVLCIVDDIVPSEHVEQYECAESFLERLRVPATRHEILVLCVAGNDFSGVAGLPEVMGERFLIVVLDRNGAADGHVKAHRLAARVVLEVDDAEMQLPVLLGVAIRRSASSPAEYRMKPPARLPVVAACQAINTKA